MKRYPSRFITMVRFPCFPAPIHYKSKKSVQRSAETLHKNSRDFSQDQASKFSISSPGSHSLDSKPNACDNDHSNTSAEKITSSSSFGTPVPMTVQTWPDVDQEGFWKSEETQDISSPETNMEILRVINLKKSQSVGSRLDREGRISSDVVDTEDEIDHGLSCDYNPVMKLDGMFDSFDHNWLSESFDYKNPENNVLNPSNCLLGLPDQPNAAVESFQMNAGLTQDGSVASVGDLKQLEREVHEDFGKQLSAEHVSDCGHHTPDTYPTIAKSCSLPDLRACVERPGKDSIFLGVSVPYSRTFEDLTVRKRGILKSEDMLRSGNALYKSGCGSSCHNVSETSYLPGKEILEVSSTRHQILCQQILGEDSFLSNHSVGSFEMVGQDRECIVERDVHDYENQFSSGQHSGNMTDVMKNWTVAEKANGDSGERLHGESSIHNWDELPCTEFKIKRIEDWVSKIDIQNSALEEVGECSTSLLQAKDDSNAICGATATKTDARISRGMEVANNYISSLTAMSTSAQMANLGLVLVPRLSIFSGLRLINLSGNAIVRITAGALPKGLHMLNLSRNNISTIEGLRELTRLRVLDLSYNRICRIGHGLASCSSLKELYLTGNKISEVEGLHRLLKLNILDLRFNKISTAKCLGQLAANYGSLQIINLEGNPAQRNVGDEQLKKSLLSLLPHLIYLNRQPIKTSSSKEVADRATRSITAHQFDRGARSEHKLSRKSAHKPASLSSHGVMAQAAGSSSKPAKSRHARQPPGKAKRTLHQVSRDSKLLSLQGSSSMRRSRSEGSL